MKGGTWQPDQLRPTFALEHRAALFMLHSASWNPAARCVCFRENPESVKSTSKTRVNNVLGAKDAMT
jgi:hypothetical protein